MSWLTADEMGSETHEGGVMQKGLNLYVRVRKCVRLTEYSCACEQQRARFLQLTGLSTTSRSLHASLRGRRE